jgi:hypothetical protein
VTRPVTVLSTRVPWDTHANCSVFAYLTSSLLPPRYNVAVLYWVLLVHDMHMPHATQIDYFMSLTSANCEDGGVNATHDALDSSHPGGRFRPAIFSLLLHTRHVRTGTGSGRQSK